MVSKVVTYNGTKCFEVDEKVIDPVAFKSFRPTYKNVGEFYEAGVRIFHVYCSGLASGLKAPYSLFGETWFGDHNYNFDNLDKQIEFFKKNAPNGYVFINVHLDVRAWWLNENPNNPNSFTHLSQIACNEKWKQDTADYLRALITHTEEKYNDYVIGYFLLGGYTTEWFSEFDHEEPNSYKEIAYKKYLHDENATIPSKEILSRPENEIFLTKNIEEIVKYRKFHNTLVADTVLYFCHEAQKVLNHKKIVGVFFGYILELLNARMWESGHIEFDKINASEDIDLLATPSSYQFRGYEQPGAYMLLCDTLERHDKACFVSFDHTTFLVPNLAQNKDRVCGDPETDVAVKLLAQMRCVNKQDYLDTREKTIQAMRREFMQRLVKRLGYWWFDMLEGWFYDKGLMQEVKKEVEISQEFLTLDRKSISEVAVFVSGESLYNVNKYSEINTELICNQRGGLNRMGTPYDMYSINDVDCAICCQYKLIIFIGAFSLTDYQREIINNLKNNGRTILFICPADLSSKGLFGAISLMEMNIKMSDIEEQNVLCEDNTFGYINSKKDCFYCEDKNVKVLGRYVNSNKNAFVVKENKDYNIVFSGIGNLSYKELQKVLKIAKVHCYNDSGEAVFVCNNLVGIFSPSHDKNVLYLKEDGLYRDIFSGKEVVSKNKMLYLDTSKENAQMFLKIK